MPPSILFVITLETLLFEAEIWSLFLKFSRNELPEVSKKKLSVRGCFGHTLGVTRQNLKKAETLAINIF